jgi:hypothetical protein
MWACKWIYYWMWKSNCINLLTLWEALQHVQQVRIPTQSYKFRSGSSKRCTTFYSITLCQQKKATAHHPTLFRIFTYLLSYTRNRTIIIIVLRNNSIVVFNGKQQHQQLSGEKVCGWMRVFALHARRPQKRAEAVTLGAFNFPECQKFFLSRRERVK